MKNKYKGSSFEEFLKDEELLQEIDILSEKQIITLKIMEIMKKQHISKSEMARRMHTKRTAVYNLLDPNKDCKLTTIVKAAKVLGKNIKIDLVSS